MSLQDKLNGFYGTEAYHKVNLTPFVVTDGVFYFAQTGEAFWAVDEICTNAMELQRKEPFLAVKLTSKDNKAELVFDDGNYNVLRKIDYPYTDLEEGEYKFYVTNGVVLLPSEY